MNLENKIIDKSQFLRDAYSSEQECLKANLQSSSRITHKGDRGEVNERYFIEFLRSYLPNRYSVEKAIVLDSEGDVSDSIDIVVFDRQYTPTLLDCNKHRYVPAEAVYAVFECKQTINKQNLEYTGEKIASVRKLKRTSVRIEYAGGTYEPKPLFEIIGGILALKVGWKDGLDNKFKKCHQELKDQKKVDCGFAATGACFDVFSKDNEYKFGPKRNSLAYFTFRLLWKLQSLATVPAVDWMAYAEKLSETK